MRKTDARLWLAALTLAIGAGLTGCSDRTNDSSRSIVAPNVANRDADAGNDQGDEDNDATIYDQTDFLGNPLVSEVTIAKANHGAYNHTQPYNTATFRPQTEAFITSFGRPPALASALGSVLYPDMIVVDPSKNPSTAGWLSWALSNGWGGRKLTDDVVDLGLTAIFSSFLSPVGALCQPFQLPLCTDNVSANDAAFSSTFPYLAAPHT
ncbi:MAG TPA: DUF4331 family protein [Gemmatimonadaceae bacterium]